MAGGNAARVIQVTNIAPQATKDQMQTLFGNIGKIEEIRLYPTLRDVSCPVQSRICYVKYADSSCVSVAQHLTNTVFIDRALIVIPVLAIPEEYRALEMSKNGTIVPGLQKPDSKLPPEVVNRIEGQSPQQVIRTYDPKLIENNLPEYPALPSYYDSRKIEEIRRTIIVCNVKNEWRLDDLIDCFQRAGEVKYARWAEKDNEIYCMIEFCEQPSIINALKLQGQEFKGGNLNVYHSTDAIIKPEAKSNEAAQKEIEEAMTIVKEAQNMISAAIDPVIGMLAKDKRRRSRSRSRSREHCSSRSRSHGSRSRKRSHSRNRRRSRSKSKRSRSRSHKRSHSRKRSHSGRKSRSRSKKHSRDRRSKRSRSRHRSNNSHSGRLRSDLKRSHSRDRERKRGHRNREEKRSSRIIRVDNNRHSASPTPPPPIRIHSSSSGCGNSNRHKEKYLSSSNSNTTLSSSSSMTKLSNNNGGNSNSSSNNLSNSSSSTSLKNRSRTPAERKIKVINDDLEIKSLRSSIDIKSRKSVSVEKSENMDISKSP